MAYISVKRQPGRLAALLLAGTCLSPVGASAQTWIGGTGTGFETGANWSTGSAPTSAQTGTFGASANTSVSITVDAQTYGGIQFSAGASAYSVNVNTGGSISVGNLSNLSGAVQNFAVSGGTAFIVDGGVANDIAFTANNSGLRLQGTSSLGNATVAVSNGGSLFLQQTASGGTAAVTLSSAGLGIDTLTGAGTTAGSIAGTGVVNLGTKTLTVGGNNQSTTFDGRIIGTGGSLVKEGTGTLTLTNTFLPSAYTGGTTINAGAISISNDANLGATSGSLTFGGGTLQTTASLTTSRTTTLNAGGGTFETTTGTLTHNGAIGGAGGLAKTGAGTLALGGTNTYLGGTTVTGGTLQVSANANLGDAAGGLTLDGGTLQATATFSSSRAVTLGTGHGTVNTNTGTTLTLSGAVDGDGNLIKAGAGTLVLGNAANSYTGITQINGGTLSIASNTSLGGGAVQFNGGTLQTTATMSMTQAMTLVGNGTLQTDAGTTLTADGDIDGAGGLTKTGAGTLILTGANTYGGGTTVSAGILQGDASTLQGNIANNATVVFQQGGDGAYVGTMSGSGGLTKRGAGTLTLTGTNSQLGTTRIEGGALSVGADANLGAANASLFLDGGTLRTTGSFTSNRLLGLLAGGGTFDITTGTVTFNGSVEDVLTPGSLTKTGAGTLVLAGTSTYTGGTTVSAGILQGTTASLRGDITNNAALVFDQSGDGSHTGTISGTGSLTKSGSGRVTLSGANTYQGGTTINGGTIAVSNASALGTAAVRLSGGNLTGVANVTLGNDITFTTGAGTIAAATGTTLTLAPNTLSFSLVPNTVMTFGSGADAGTVVYSAATSFITNVAFSTVVGGGTLRAGAATFGSLTGNAQATTVVNAGAILDFNDFSSTVTNLQGGGSVVTGVGAGTALTVSSGNFSGVISGAGQLLKSGSGTLVLSGTNTYTGGTTVSGGILGGTTSSLQGNILNNATVGFEQSSAGIYAGVMSGGGSLLKLGSGTVVLTGANTYTGGTTVSGGTLQGNTTSLQGNILNNANVTFDQPGAGTYGGVLSGAGSLTKIGPGTLILGGNNVYSGGTTVTGGILQGTTTSLQGNILNNATVSFNQTGSGTYAGNMSGSGGLLINGTGTVILGGTNTYAGGTTVSGGILQGNALSLQGSILNNAAVVFNQTGTGTYAGVMSGTGGMTLQGGSVLTMTGNNLYTGATTVTGSGLVVNGSLASTVTLDSTSMIGGTGTIGGLVSNAGTLAPGNSIGTLTVTGNFTQTGGTYQVEANAAGQSDRVNVTGTATINGGTVQVLAASGSYGNSTTYTILNATGGLSGVYSNVTSNFAFLTPSLSYNTNNVFLTLALQGNAFSGFGGNTVNQRSVGYALDQSYANASGDFATVIGALAGLTTQQGPWALNQISGQPYADFGSFNVANNALFMNALGQQMALARGGRGSGQRQALAQACEVEACDAASPFSVWGSLLGGVGSLQGNGNSQTFTYNVGGTAAGIDYRLTPSFLVGVSAGYSNGTQWVDSFQGKGWSNSVSVAAYGSFTQSAFYVDALAGYAYSNNQMQRQISIPNLQPRTANGSTGVNQFLAQVEAGYAMPVYAPAAATVTPFARFQTSSINQAAFNEWGANSLSLNVQQQTTTSVRTTLGADLAAAIGNVDLGLRLGWLHEYANTARPISAAFAGAPSASFTVYGATPQRDAAVIGFQASANVAAATQLYLRYDGEIAAGSDNHILNVGLRLSW